MTGDFDTLSDIIQIPLFRARSFEDKVSILISRNGCVHPTGFDPVDRVYEDKSINLCMSNFVGTENFCIAIDVLLTFAYPAPPLYFLLNW